MKASKILLQAIAVTAEITGTQLSEPAARVFADDLARYPEAQILGALQRCRREVKGRLTVADVVGRIEDGRPTPDEAWAMCPHDERQSVVWTDEMAKAWGIAHEADDRVSARMAFLAVYRKLVQEARDQALRVVWTPSLGHDPHGRAHAVEEAVRLGRLGAQHGELLLAAPSVAHQSVALPRLGGRA